MVPSVRSPAKARGAGLLGAASKAGAATPQQAQQAEQPGATNAAADGREGAATQRPYDLRIETTFRPQPPNENSAAAVAAALCRQLRELGHAPEVLPLALRATVSTERPDALEVGVAGQEEALRQLRALQEQGGDLVQDAAAARSCAAGGEEARAALESPQQQMQKPTIQPTSQQKQPQKQELSGGVEERLRRLQALRQQAGQMLG